MSSFRFSLIPGRPAQEVFSNIPPEFAKYLQRGFALLSKVAPKHYQALAEQAVEALDLPTLRGDERLAADLGLKEDDIGPLVAAVSMVGLVLTSTDETPESFVEAGLAAKILSGPDKSALLELSRTIVRDRGRMKDAMRRSSVASSVLPTMASFDTEVDMRMGFAKGEIDLSVPVILAHIDTDAVNEELWLQMSKSQLKSLLDNLQETLRRVEQVEAWFDQRASKQR